MTDRLVDTPAFRKAVEALGAMASHTCYARCDCRSCLELRRQALTAALPHLRRALAEELRAENDRQATDPLRWEPSYSSQMWNEAADFVEGA